MMIRSWENIESDLNELSVIEAIKKAHIKYGFEDLFCHKVEQNKIQLWYGDGSAKNTAVHAQNHKH